MKFTLSWLRAHLDTDAALARITDTLTAIGLELESVEDRGAALAPFRIAHVLDATPHPNADRLRVCTVETGGETVTVVCGAPNARRGMKAVFAPPGSVIPATGTVLKVGEIRGVQSAGMLVSARELALGEDHTGIIELPEEAPLGVPYAAWLGLDDPVIDIAVTPNRGDALAVRGVARDLAAAGIGTLRPWNPEPVEGGFPSPVGWRIDWPEACPWVLGRTVRNLRNGPSPQWLQERLAAIGLRPINALVDITNFLTIDLGRPLHVFDADKVTGGALAMRRGAGETFRALNGRDCTVTDEDCVIADAAGVQSLAGVMGGAATGSDEATRSVFVECALFDPVRVALTGRRHGIISDARQRFERGIDPALLAPGLQAATRMILECCGGEPSAVAAAGHEPRWQRSASLRFARLRELGGADVPPDEAVGALQRLGFTVEARDAERVTVAVPSWRNDVEAILRNYTADPGLRSDLNAETGLLDQAPALSPAHRREVAEACAQTEPEYDLIEEVLRLRGLDTVPPVSLPQAEPVPPPALTAAQSRTALVRRTLAAEGLAECVTFSFLPSATAALFGPAPSALRLVNPIAADLDQLRPTPVATLALAAARNAARGQPDLGLFEIGPAFAPEQPQGQHLVAAGLRTGATPRNWAAPARPIDAMDAKADLWGALTAAGAPLEGLTVTADAPGFYHSGRSGVVRQGRVALGTFGELHPRLVAALDLPAPAVVFELLLDAVPEPKRRKRAAADLSPLQPVRRDFAFLVGAEVAAETLLRAARGAERGLIAGVTLFDVFAGGGLPDGQKSIGIEVVFQPRDRTLTDAEIDAAAAKVVAAVAKATGGVLRSSS
ncbi:MAG: phenylalanine--tRNA ligase subunit beta [Acetobacteraceae bacterium]|nr:phenylalanine--tRNA ligase subunit beta [Acetobacteraceae bacterium]